MTIPSQANPGLLRLNATLRLFLLSVISLTALIWLTGCSEGGTEKKPLYWVAPMDPDYRRDGPGKSPMGMDLVPVYEPSASATSDAQGLVTISPEVQNQLGVRTAKVERDRLPQRLRSFGRVAFDQTLVLKLSPRVSGWVDMLFVATEGERVARGQPLYALYSPQLIAAQEHFLAVWRSRNAPKIREAEADLRALKFDEIALKKLKAEGVAQQSVVFHAAKDGVIGMLKIGEDFYVEPGYLMMSLGSLENVWVELDVFNSQASLIKPRQLLTLTTPSHPGKVWEGEVDYIYPALDSKSQSLHFRANIDNPGMLLKPNMLIQGHIELPERQAEILAPRQAIIHFSDQDRVVLALGEGRFKSVAVTLGESNNDFIEVLEGLTEGDTLVTSAHFLIDSESSKTSDFKRMLSTQLSESQLKYPPTWVAAKVLNIDLDERKLRLSHDHIDAWQMPGMTMNFQVADGVDMTGLREGDQLRVHIRDGDPLFQVTKIQLEGQQ